MAVLVFFLSVLCVIGTVLYYIHIRPPKINSERAAHVKGPPETDTISSFGDHRGGFGFFLVGTPWKYTTAVAVVGG